MKVRKAVTFAALPALVAATALAGSVAAAPRAQAAPVVNITARNYTYDAPDSLPAGPVELQMRNSSPEPHHAQIFRLNEGVGYDDLTTALQSEDFGFFALVSSWGGNGTTDPGKSSDVIVNLEPGQYAMLCFISGSDGVPHVAKGMLKPFTVAESGTRAAPPVEDGTIKTRDFSFDLPEFKKGPNTLKIENEGPQPHEFSLIKLGEGKSLTDVFAFFESSEDGPPPFEDAGGFQALDPGRIGWTKLDLSPGNYVALCTVPDPDTGKSHAELGMIAGFEIP